MFFTAVRLQRNRKTPERITIGKLLYFRLSEFVGEFFRKRRVADRVLIDRTIRDRRRPAAHQGIVLTGVAFVLDSSAVVPAGYGEGKPDEQSGHSPRQR